MIQTRVCNSEDFDEIAALLRQLWPDKPLTVGSPVSGLSRSRAICGAKDFSVLSMSWWWMKRTATGELERNFSTISFQGRASGDAIGLSWTLRFIGRPPAHFMSVAASRAGLIFIANRCDRKAPFLCFDNSSVKNETSNEACEF